MIRAVAFCPAAPVLVPDVAQGAAGELDELRAACRTAIRTAAAPGRQVLLLSSDRLRGHWTAGDRGTLGGFGLPLDVSLGSRTGGRADLPPALTVGAWLVGDALGPVDDIAAVSVGSDLDGLQLVVEGDQALVVVGDGSARRGVKAPGYLDERAAAFDAGVGAALRDADPATLAALDGDLGAELLAAGVPAWRAAGALLTDTVWDAQLLWSGDPYGVACVAAVWTARD